MYVSIIPGEPIMNAGKTSGQYLSALPVKGRRIVEMKTSVWPKRMIHLRLMFPVKATVNDASIAVIPKGTL